jgi:uncharacterized protein
MWKSEWKPLLYIIAGFLLFYFLPVGSHRFDNAVFEALSLAKWYAREHVLLCLVPAFFIAGAIAVFISQGSVMKYLGANANKFLAYGVASVSGSILAVCSCTVLPLFTGIYKMGAGLGPAIAFLYSGPAINVLAIILTARVLGFEIGLARALGAILFSIVIGLVMHFIYIKEETEKCDAQMALPSEEPKRPLWQNAFFFALLAAVLIFSNWADATNASYIWQAIYSLKWQITSVSFGALLVLLISWFNITPAKVIISAVLTAVAAFLFPANVLAPFSVGIITFSIMLSSGKGEAEEWFAASWEFAKQIFPLLIFGVLVSGFLLGRPGNEGMIPSAWVAALVGGNSIASNLIASIIGAFMYFATLTEIPIVQGLINSGMGKGPALALLLAGPSLSLPSMLVIRSVLGTQKTIVYSTLVITMATLTGFVFGALF